MSKSLGNFFTIREVLGRYAPAALRWFLVGSQYRQPVNYTLRALEEVRSMGTTGRLAALLAGQFHAARARGDGSSIAGGGRALSHCPPCILSCCSLCASASVPLAPSLSPSPPAFPDGPPSPRRSGPRNNAFIEPARSCAGLRPSVLPLPNPAGRRPGPAGQPGGPGRHAGGCRRGRCAGAAAARGARCTAG